MTIKTKVQDREALARALDELAVLRDAHGDALQRLE